MEGGGCTEHQTRELCWQSESDIPAACRCAYRAPIVHERSTGGCCSSGSHKPGSTRRMADKSRSSQQDFATRRWRLRKRAFGGFHANVEYRMINGQHGVLSIRLRRGSWPRGSTPLSGNERPHLQADFRHRRHWSTRHHRDRLVHRSSHPLVFWHQGWSGDLRIDVRSPGIGFRYRRAKRIVVSQSQIQSKLMPRETAASCGAQLNLLGPPPVLAEPT